MLFLSHLHWYNWWTFYHAILLKTPFQTPSSTPKLCTLHRFNVSIDIWIQLVTTHSISRSTHPPRDNSNYSTNWFLSTPTFNRCVKNWMFQRKLLRQLWYYDARTWLMAAFRRFELERCGQKPSEFLGAAWRFPQKSSNYHRCSCEILKFPSMSTAHFAFWSERWVWIGNARFFGGFITHHHHASPFSPLLPHFEFDYVEAKSVRSGGRKTPVLPTRADSTHKENMQRHERWRFYQCTFDWL